MYCTSCGKDAGNNLICPNCGSAQPSKQTLRCSACGNHIGPGNEPCSVCGNRVFNTGQINPLQGSALGIQTMGVIGRAIPGIIDLIILSAFNLAIAKLLGGTAQVDSSGTLSTHLSVEGTPVFIMMFGPLAYWVLMEGIFGKTIGKWIMGLKVVMEDGSRISFKAALIRNLLRIIDLLPFFYAIGAIFILGSDKNQRLGDRVAKTIIIKGADPR